jgi:NAD(P)-dependent dehydrogenase (short-subunit alcohol dehydrogenase family)
VLLAARSEEKMRPVLAAFQQRGLASRVEFVHLDLSDFASIRRAAEQVMSKRRSLDGLVNNAGTSLAGALTRDGFEMVTGTNHLGHFLLTQLLLPRVADASQGRVVNVTSGAHYGVKQIDWELLRTAMPRNRSFPMYALSKLMNVLHARELARRLAGRTRITTYAVHPGVIASDIWRPLPKPVQWAIKLFMSSTEQGAKPLLQCATAPELSSSSGRYFDKMREVPPSPLAQDDELAAKLWQWSEDATGTRSLPLTS